MTGFHVKGFWAAVLGSLVISLVSFFIGMPSRRARQRPSAQPGTPPPGNGPIIDV